MLENITNLLLDGKWSCIISDELGICKSPVNNARGRLSGPFSNVKSGRPSKLSDREKRQIVYLTLTERAKNVSQATNLINRERESPISRYTVRRVLLENLFKVRKRLKKPALSAANKKARLEWAFEHEEWTVDDWKRVYWSDETKINHINNDGKRFCWIRPGSQLSNTSQRNSEIWRRLDNDLRVHDFDWSWPDCSYRRSDEWGGVRWQRSSVFKTKLKPTIEACNLIPELSSSDQIIFQQDNDPKHTCRLAKCWFEANNIVLMRWPAQSAVFNPIEHIWCHLKVRLGECGDLPKGLHEMWDKVRTEWFKVAHETCKNLISSMARRCQAVIRARWGWTKYWDRMLQNRPNAQRQNVRK